MRSRATALSISAWVPMQLLEPQRRLAPGPMRRLARSTGTAVLDLLLPPECATCDTPVAAPGLFCAACFQRANFVTDPCCRCCGVPFTHAGQGTIGALCPTCAEDPPAFARARAALRYDAHARRRILPLKHADRTDLARTLAPLMARAGAALLREADILVPVPLHRARLFQRRYNQAALLARALSRSSGLPTIPDALIRIRPTTALGDKSARERMEEVGGAFALRPARAAAIAGRRILLIDDVMTSGATADACARALLDAGAGAVDVLVAARVPDPRLESPT